MSNNRLSSFTVSNTSGTIATINTKHVQLVNNPTLTIATQSILSVIPPGYSHEDLIKVAIRVFSEDSAEILAELLSEYVHPDPWFDVPEDDKNIIRAAVQALLGHLKDGL